MNVKITCYLGVVSSWCCRTEAGWAELKKRDVKWPAEFEWQVALLDAEGRSKSREQTGGHNICSSPPFYGR